MILGMKPYTFVHVVISLIGVVTGLLVIPGMLTGQRQDALTAVFLITTFLTSATGFGFPFEKLLPSHIVGIISLVILVPAFLGRYVYQLAGPWRWIYVVTAMIALYLNVFVGVVQAFQKVPYLNAKAPTQSEPPFAIAQVAVLVLFVILTILAVLRFFPGGLPTA